VLDPERTADQFERRLRALGSPERAIGEQRYLKSELDHLGATVWQNRREVKVLAKEHEALTRAELTAVVEAMWSRRIFELRQGAAFLLEAYPDLVTPTDLPLIKRLIKQSKTWALVDVLAGDVLGELLIRHPQAAPKLDSWATDDDFWVRRAALLAHLDPLKQGASMARFAGYADAMLDEREFFIRKAIGWVLRETAKRRPDEVFAWLAPRTHRASGITMREAVKYIDVERREQLMTAYKERRAAA
jgi:3-methyladenine DNA glycosylase AlkD